MAGSDENSTTIPFSQTTIFSDVWFGKVTISIVYKRIYVPLHRFFKFFSPPILPVMGRSGVLCTVQRIYPTDKLMVREGHGSLY